LKRLLVLAAIAVVALAACGSSNKSSSSSTTASPSTSSSPSSSSSTNGTVNMNIGNPTSATTVTEAGSSLLYPYLQLLVNPLHSAYSNVTLAPAAGGSGKGISDTIAGTVNVGGSDAYLSNSEFSSNPGLMNIPIAVSSQAVNYNLPGVTSLKLNGNVLAEIYQGKITKWNDSAITALNPGVTLPSTGIVPVRRVDSSGDTFIFTSFLSATNSTWNSGPAFGTTITWPAVSAEVTASGNPGMVQTCHATPGCIAYIGISAESTALSAGLGEAELQNKAGNYVLPNQATVESAVNAGSSSLPANLAAPLIYEPGAQSYPIVNFEYIIVKSSQSSSNLAMAIRTFLAFAISPSGGSAPSFLAKNQFVALPQSVVPLSESAIAKISG
jgi:phosphate transport system substrate-binding protein